jgi:hypothetical protein
MKSIVRLLFVMVALAIFAISIPSVSFADDKTKGQDQGHAVVR